MSKFDNSGSLSKNARKEKDTQPDVKGRATVDGVEYWISGWRREGEDGAWYSLAFERKEKTQDERPKERNGKTADRRPTTTNDDESIPF